MSGVTVMWHLGWCWSCSRWQNSSKFLWGLSMSNSSSAIKKTYNNYKFLSDNFKPNNSKYTMLTIYNFDIWRHILTYDVIIDILCRHKKQKLKLLLPHFWQQKWIPTKKLGGKEVSFVKIECSVVEIWNIRLSAKCQKFDPFFSGVTSIFLFDICDPLGQFY